MNMEPERVIRAAIDEAEEVTEPLDEAAEEAERYGKSRSPKQADILVGLAAEAELFHDPDGIGYADLRVDRHSETWRISSKQFRQWLQRRFYEAAGGAPNSEALQAALNLIEARAKFDGPEMDVHVRVAGRAGKLYLDLADDAWRVVEIDEQGWRLVDSPPVRFRRRPGMRPLPIPVGGGSVDVLRSFLNVRNNEQFVLVISWMLAALRNTGPYAILVLAGEQGSAKTTFCRVVRALLDPNSTETRALSREERDLFIAATNGHVLAFDNVSHLAPWISDALCRLATGGGFGLRQLYTDQDEMLFDATRPIILNGIEDVVTRPDLADRAIFLNLEPIPETRRRSEDEFWADFHSARPQILGVLLDAVVHGLRHLPETRLERLPRMADFAKWATACETALWLPGTFLVAYDSNRDEAADNTVEADPVSSAVRSLVTKRGVWSGTASGLLAALTEEADDTVRKSKAWPTTPRALSGRLRRSATPLRAVGIRIEFGKEGRARTRTIRLSSVPEKVGSQPSAPSAPSAVDANMLPTNDLDTTWSRTNAGREDATELGRPAPSVRANPLSCNEADDADDADAKIPAQSSGWRGRV